jgi:hypothetical protein
VRESLHLELKNGRHMELKNTIREEVELLEYVVKIIFNTNYNTK